MELERYLAPLRKWWWLLLVSAILTAISSYIVVDRQPPVYEAKSTLMIGSAFENPNPTGGELNLGTQLAYTYADIAQRQPVREQTKAALGLDWLPTYTARQLPQSQLLEIVVIDTNPALAQAVANELANQLILQSPTAPRPEEQERETFINGQLSGLQSKIKETEAEIIDKEDQLENAFSAREIADLEGEILGLQNKLNTLQGNYASLLANTQSGAINTLTLIEPAAMPVQPVGPDKARTVLTTVVIALALAAGTAYLLEYLDDSMTAVDDVSRASNLPSLPSIPEIKAVGNPQVLVALDQPRAPATDAFRALRAAIQFRDRDRTNRLILVTSAKPKEGKSIVSANLAIVLAQAGYKVLLIDADLRLPTQHKLFSMPNHKGLVDLLVDPNLNDKNMDIAALLSNIAQQSAQERLNIIVSGPTTEVGPELLSLDIMHDMLSVAASSYDYVVIDSPPLLAAADALILSTEVDSVILISYAGKTRRKELQQAIKQLNDVDAHTIGVVLNRQRHSGEAYSYRYGKYYQASKASTPLQTGEQKQTNPNGNKPKEVGESSSAAKT